MATKRGFTVFWPLLKGGCSMDYHGNHYFTDIKLSDFAAGRPDVAYIIELNHMLHYNLLSETNNAHLFHFK